MKKKAILLPLAGILLYVLLSSYSEGPFYDSGGTIDGTGARGSTTGCSTGGTCHTSGASSTTAVTVQLLSGTTPVTCYVPGTTYTVKISGINNSTTVTNLGYFGFEVCIVNASGAGTGSATTTGVYGTAPSGTHWQTISGFTMFEQYAGGGPAAIAATTGTGGTGTTYVESISWTAPSAGTGSVVLYGVLNAVNHDGVAGLSDGDLWNIATPVTINEAPAGISGTLTVCAGSTTTLSAGGTGTWSTTGPYVSVVASTGVVTGLTGPGTQTVNYTSSCGTVSVVVTVNPAPASISGTTSLCVGATTTLSDASAGGTWSSGTTGAATIVGSGTTGTVTGVGTGGTSLIKYTFPTGCFAGTTVTVNPTPPAITGSLSLCQGATVSLTSGTGGTWSSGSPGVATVSSTGVVTGLITGATTPATSVITYSSSGCSVSAIVTVNPLPGVISGAGTVCPGANITLTDGGTGSWTSLSPSIASVVSGVVTGVAAAGGTAVIRYALPVTGCSVAKTITVNPAPGSISGATEVCAGATTTLSDGGGGTWTSSSPTVAVIGSTSGIVAGILSSGGSSIITYALPVTGCSTTTIVSVDPAPSPISGVMNVCVGAVTTLSDAGGGAWTNGGGGAGSIDPTGNVTGISPGTIGITYFLPVTGCSATAVVTVNATPVIAAITGTMNVCVGATITLSDATPGGTWGSGSPVIATIGSTGIVTGAGAGVSPITYSVANGSGCSSFVTANVTVNPTPLLFGGANHVCTGATITLTESSVGTWTSGTPGIASVTTPGATTTLTGVSAGTSAITYSLAGTGCSVISPVTVNQTPNPISGTPTVCIGLTTTLTDILAGGIWSSSTTHASVGTGSGTVTGVSFGTSTISYTLGTCFATKLITVNVVPAAISGPTQVCIGSTITLIDAGGGTWSSSNSNATVSGSGVVTGVAAGTSVITYTIGSTSCYQTTTITINSSPSAISGLSTVCRGAAITLTDTDPGSWSSSVPATATVGSGTGVVTGVAAGNVNIIFTNSTTGCSITHPVTVNPISAIGGLSSLCAGTTTTLTDGTGGGSWVSSSPSVATIGSSSALVNAIGPGSTTITYSLLTGCTATSTLNVISAPTAISGPSTVCLGSTITLVDAGGGTFTSSNPSVATVGSLSGIVTPVITGTTTITYSLGTGCTVSAPVTVTPAASSISGASVVCEGSTIALTDAGGGTWSSSNANATVGSTGIVTGVTGGPATITYTVGSGCYATKALTINSLPATIGGTLNVCVGATTSLSDGTPGGTWTSLNPPQATVVASTGLVTGVAPVTATIKYTVTATGCSTSAVVTINANPTAITGTATVCVGNTTSLTDAGGGAWTTSNANATVDPTGLVSGVTAGTSVVTYTLSTGCHAVKTVTINPLPLAITGTLTVCEGSATLLGDPTGSGAWTSVSPTIATISTGGSVSGISGGTSVISYTLATGCAQTAIVTVNSLPGVISGTTGICLGGISTLTDGAGGTWSSTLPGIATIGSSSGVVNTVSAGTTTISYTLPTGCARTIPVVVHPLPLTISGPDSVCTGATAVLTDGGGGTWLSGTTASATIGSSSGIVTGVAVGTSDITYTLSTGCSRSVTVTVHPSPSIITGTDAVCVGAATTLSDVTTGGTWSSSAPGTATVGTTGIVSGIAAGLATVSYTIGFGCSATAAVTVNPLPSAISGIATVCPGATTILSDGGGGSWTSSNITIATAGSSTGIITGVAAGIDTITYALATGCMTTMPITVNPLPFAGVITGPSTVCADSSITLADAAAGGVWSSLFTSNATVGTTGIVTGVSAGADSIYYAVTNSCGTATVAQALTVNPLPVAGTITGPASVCMSAPATLADTAAGGTWSSSLTTVASIGATTGVLTTVAPGITTIMYSVTNGCGTASATIVDTVVALPAVDPLVGADSVCQGDTIHLGDLITGGTWTVTNANATVDGTGLVTGVTAGTDTVKYSITTACGTATASLLVNIRSVTICDAAVKPQPGMASGFKVYPNPSTGVFTVDMPETPVSPTVVITDVLGKTIETRYLTDTRPQQVIFDLSKMVPGSYLLKVNAGNTTYRQKIVIW